MSPRDGRDLHLWAQGNEKGVNEIIFLGYLKARIKQAQKAASMLLTWHSQRASGHCWAGTGKLSLSCSIIPTEVYRDRRGCWNTHGTSEQIFFFLGIFFANCSFIPRLEEDVPWLSSPNQPEAAGCIYHISRACKVFCNHLRGEILFSQCGKTALEEEERSSMRLTLPTRTLIGPQMCCGPPVGVKLHLNWDFTHKFLKDTNSESSSG